MLENFLVVVSVIGARPGDVREIARGIDDVHHCLDGVVVIGAKNRHEIELDAAGEDEFMDGDAKGVEEGLQDFKPVLRLVQHRGCKVSACLAMYQTYRAFGWSSYMR